MARPDVDPRTARLLEAPITPTLLRLAIPNVLVMVVQAGVSAAEVYFVGWLGTDALAGISLVFPFVMLMQMMSAGGMGAGVASAIARALGAGRRQDAEALVIHALIIGLAMGTLFTIGVGGSGPFLYHALGVRGPALEAALAYSNVVFSGALALWTLNTLANIVRGTGNMIVPAGVVLTGAVIVVGLSPLLIFGWGPMPPLGIVGAGVALVTYYVTGSLALLGYLLSGRGILSLRVRGVRIRAALFKEILRIGGIGALNTLQTNLVVIFVTGLVAPFGTIALAGYGIGARLEYLQIPLVFGFASALVTMVGINVGAGEPARAKRVAWIGAGMAGGVTGTIGILAAIFPEAWTSLFTSEAGVAAAASDYLHLVGPFYGFLGMGLALYSSSQGAGSIFWPFMASVTRLAIVVGGGWLVVRTLGLGPRGLFATLALGLLVFGIANAVIVRMLPWRR